MNSLLLEKRIFAFIIDIVIILIPNLYIAIVFFDYIMVHNLAPKNYLTISLMIQFLPFLSYFFFTELLFKKTVGKHIFKLNVKTIDKRFYRIFIRTLCRLIPIDPITFFFYKDKLLHDVLSKTSVEIKTSK